MTTAQALVTDAFRELNVIPIGKEPSEAELAEGLSRLNNYIDSLFGATLGEYLRDWPITRLFTAPQFRPTPLGPDLGRLANNVRPYPPLNARLVARLTTPKTIYAFPSPIDGAQLAVADAGSTAELTIDANGRRINGADSVSFTPSGVRRWFYRADLAEWREITPLALEDESLLPAEFDDLFITGIAIRLAPRFGKRAAAETVAVQQAQAQKVKTRYAQTEARLGVFDPTFYSHQTFSRGDVTSDAQLYGD